LRYLLIFWFYFSALVLSSLPANTPALAAPAQAEIKPMISGIAPPDFFGVVGRDPSYEWNTDPVLFKDQLNLNFLDNMAREIRKMGARWIRIEFHAESRPGARGGYIDYNKYDAFINDIAPRYGLKVLALVGADAITAKNPDDQDLNYIGINEPADRPDGSNTYIRFFAVRAREIMSHYGERIAAYELLNEQNLWYGFTAKPENVGALMMYTYTLAKAEQPKAKILMGGVFASPKVHADSVAYLGQIYASPAVQQFFKTGQHYDSPFPFDGVAWHPYFPQASEAIKSVRDAVAKMRSWGDNANKLWVTEVSLSGRPNLPIVCGISPDEQNQADFLYELYTELAKNQDDIAAVFWFKYEDFYDQSGYEPWGLVRLETDADGRYKPFGKVVYYKLGYRIYQTLSGPALPIDRVAAPPPGQPNTYYFEETGHNLTGVFKQYWETHGGLPLFGFPLTEAFFEQNPSDQKTYLVQYFERERFEYHPESKNPAYQIQLGLLGRQLLAVNCRDFPRAAPPQAGANPDSIYFKESGHYLGGAFKRYWQQKGGLAIFGYPVSEEFGEVNPSDGKFYVVQWFERARFEYHPEAAGTPNEVQLGLLGSQWLKWQGWTH
jgi:hypothetical protein